MFPTAPLPDLVKLQAAAPLVQKPSYNPALKIAWCREVFFLLKNHYPHLQGILFTDTTPALVVIDRVLAHLAHTAVGLALCIADSFTPEPNQQMPHYVAEAIAMRLCWLKRVHSPVTLNIILFQRFAITTSPRKVDSQMHGSSSADIMKHLTIIDMPRNVLSMVLRSTSGVVSMWVSKIACFIWHQ